ncbi:MAG: hypothetical protein GWM87_11375, partial [Xanthomonadales bacterium]|nr:hypothetical protein [Xanthomonadales bacterium]NIX13468.1 hypothetical protein [Xanthomonadales bacterium]
VQGAVNPDEFYVYKPALRSGHQAVLRRTLGSKAIRMVYDVEGGVRTEDVEPEMAHRFSITDAEAEDLARQAVTI